MNNSTAPDPHPSTEERDDSSSRSRDDQLTVEAHYAGLGRLEAPHACYDGVVYVGHLVEDPATGDEVERIEALPCRRCASEAGR